VSLRVPSAGGDSAPRAVGSPTIEPGEARPAGGPCSMSGRVSTRPESEARRCDSAMYDTADGEVGAPSRDGPPAAGARRRAPAYMMSRGPGEDPPSCSPVNDVRIVDESRPL
jgi:hypothetical protein